MPLPGEDAMKNLPKEKRNQLILAVMLTGIVLSSLWFGLIGFQQQSLRTIANNREVAARKFKLMEQTIKNASQIETDLGEDAKQLAQLENGMVSGDPYSWAINTIKQFKASHRVEIPQFSGIDGPKDVSLLPGFPYKQATMTVGGTALFHDFGRFVADFENQFPYARILNLDLEPFTGMATTGREKLSFRLDIVMLVKPSAS
jgi:hypothetical protein